ncbi:MAG TPA: helix-turn-helix domain-containing protein [Candidatus Limnocylindrales bacterium]|nr:helix-turn-helix domain-containing protein [Candidatus Limnocylindrales bacterium]
MPHKSLGRRLAVLDRGIAESVGARIRTARLAAGLTQSKLAEGRYTKAYISALENGLSKPSLAALNFIAGRLSLPVTHFLGDPEGLAGPTWSRVEADLRLAAGDWQAASDAYRSLLEVESQPVRRAELETGLAEALCRLDQVDEAIRVASSAAAAFDSAGEAAQAAMARYWLAAAFYQREDEAEAASIFRGVLERIRAGVSVEPDFEARVLMALSAAVSRGGDDAQAAGYLEEARALIDTVSDRRRAVFLTGLAYTYRERGDFEAAMRLANQALARYRETFLDREVALLENDLALTYSGMGLFDRARDHAATGEAQMRAIGDERGRAHIVETRAQIELAAGDLRAAEEIGNEALDLANAQGNRKAAISAALTLAEIARRGGDLSRASVRMEAAAALAREHGRPQQLRDVLTEWSEILAELGDDKGAYRLSREALALGKT